MIIKDQRVDFQKCDILAYFSPRRWNTAALKVGVKTVVHAKIYSIGDTHRSSPLWGTVD